MKGRRGFALIELLVVVGIIAILVAILLPSLSKAKGAAKTAVCLANERGLAQALHVYVEGFGTPRLNSQPVTGFAVDQYYPLVWDYTILGQGSSYGAWAANNGAGRGIDRVRFCPEAAAQTPGGGLSPGGAHLKYCIRYPLNMGQLDSGEAASAHRGSYAVNVWVSDPDAAAASNILSGFSLGGGTVVTQSPAGFYRRPLLSNAQGVPVFVDGSWNEVVPYATDMASSNLENPLSGRAAALSGSCLNRHNTAVNVSFFDGHAETVKLPNLWTLKWSADWSRTEPAVVPGK